MILRFVRLNDLDADHQAQTANVTDHRITFLQLGQLAFEPFALSGHFVGDLMLLQVLQGGQAGGHRQLVAAEGAGVVARFPGIELFFDAQHRERQAAADRFRHHDDVRLDAGVDDQQNAVFLRHFANALQPLGRGRVNPAFALNGFQDHRRRFTHAAFHVVNQIIEVVGQRLDAGFAADAQRAAVFMRVRHELHFRHHAVDGRFRRQVAGDRQRAVGHAVVAAGEADHAGTAGVFFRQLQRGFHRIGAGRAAELQAVPFAFAR
ncbi:Uncharacterised protein [Acinetobacter baumannii]|nr:Uncharacterised protein [Acinetobacter baumannii]